MTASELASHSCHDSMCLSDRSRRHSRDSDPFNFCPDYRFPVLYFLGYYSYLRAPGLRFQEEELAILPKKKGGLSGGQDMRI